MTNAQDNSRIPISISLDQLTDQPTAATGGNGKQKQTDIHIGARSNCWFMYQHTRKIPGASYQPDNERILPF